MGEYECIDCNEMYHLDEPPEGYSICWDCREERKNEATSKENRYGIAHTRVVCS